MTNKRTNACVHAYRIQYTMYVVNLLGESKIMPRLAGAIKTRSVKRALGRACGMSFVSSFWLERAWKAVPS